VLTSSLEDDVPALRPSSSSVMEEVPSVLGADVDLGGDVGAGPIMAVLTPVLEGPNTACPVVEVLSATFSKEGAPERRGLGAGSASGQSVGVLETAWTVETAEVVNVTTSRAMEVTMVPGMVAADALQGSNMQTSSSARGSQGRGLRF
jgi:hypothetical protein